MGSEEEKLLKSAGVIANEVLSKGIDLIKEGSSVIEILEELEKTIYEKDAIPAFPSQISINNVAAHFCPTKDADIIIKANDIVKLDVGICKEGYIADTARTKSPAGDNDLIKSSREALDAALKIVRPGVTLGEIGKTIHEVITSYGFSPIRNLSGHGLDYFEIHAPPSIPNFDTKDKKELKENQVIAIEPFASDGAGIVYESTNPTIFTLISEKQVRSKITREVMQNMKRYHGLPFTTRWIVRRFGEGKTAFALRELRSLGSLQEHPPLLDKSKGLVSQAEHSVIVKDKPIVYTKKDE